MQLVDIGFAAQAPKLQAWLSQLEIETTDLWGLFKMLDQGALLRAHLREDGKGVVKLLNQTCLHLFFSEIMRTALDSCSA